MSTAVTTPKAKLSGSLADLCSALDASIGENDGNSAVAQFIDTGYAPLNYAISGRYDGGLPFGRMVEMFGESSSGKTALATQWMVEAQKMGGCAVFVDWERSFDVGLAEGFGLNTERPFWIYGKPKTWEAGNTFAGKACRAIRQSKAIPDDAPILVVFDSIASAVPQSMLTDSKGKEREIDDYTMNDTSALSRVTSTTLKVMAQYCEEYNATFLYLNQMRLKIGVVFGDPRCLRGDTMIPFVDGTTAAIGDIVKNKIAKPVWSYNESSGQIEQKNIIDWHDNGSIADTDKEFIHIRVNTPETSNGVSAITVTNDHLVFVATKGWIESSKVVIGDMMLSRSVNKFSGKSLEFLKGVIACDASVKPVSVKRQGHSLHMIDSNDPEYAAWKAATLAQISKVSTLTLGSGGIRHSMSASSELSRVSHLARKPVELFNDGITPMQLALVVMDDGFYDISGERNRYLISFKRFKGNSDYLNEIGAIFEKLGLTYSIRYGQGRLDFDKANSRKIAEMIAPHIHPSMERKLPLDLRGQFQDVIFTSANESVIVEAEVVEVRRSGKKLDTRMYDITVEGNHNFLAGNALNGVVVHNCTPGGKAMEFYATARLAIGRTKIMEQTAGVKEFVGQKIGIQVTKSKLTKPFKECDLRMSYDEFGVARFDTTYSLVETLIEQKKLPSPGNGYVTWTDGKRYSKRAMADKADAEKLVPELVALLSA